jgi:hypothetical protein
MSVKVVVVRGPFRGSEGVISDRCRDAAGRPLYWVRFAAGGLVEASIPKDHLRRPVEPVLVHPVRS